MMLHNTVEGVDREGQEKRFTFERATGEANNLNAKIDMMQNEKLRLMEAIEGLEQERTMLLGNREQYDRAEVDLQN